MVHCRACWDHVSFWNFGWKVWGHVGGNDREWQQFSRNIWLTGFDSCSVYLLAKNVLLVSRSWEIQLLYHCYTLVIPPFFGGQKKNSAQRLGTFLWKGEANGQLLKGIEFLPRKFEKKNKTVPVLVVENLGENMDRFGGLGLNETLTWDTNYWRVLV